MIKTFLSVFLLVILGFIIFAESRSMPLFKAVKNFFLMVYEILWRYVGPKSDY